MKHSISASDYDVAIVGLGPVGSTLAGLLGMSGVRTLVLEREASTFHLPRAVHFDDESMRVFQTLGLSDDLLPKVMLTPGMKFVDAAGRLLLDWQRSAGVTPMTWNASYRFHQPDLEELLNAGLRRWPSVTVRNRCDVFAIDQDPTGVRLRYESLDNGRLEEVRSAYVVGCDGARSLVRRFIGSGMEDLGFHERWLVVDVLLERDRPDLGDYSIQFCNPERPATYIRGTGNRRRWEISVHPHEDAARTSQPERVWELLSPWLTPDDAVLERAAIYTFHSVIAERWQEGRLLLAGDSAHQTPPFLGQGMCAGIRDASNLAWKLRDVVSGIAPPSLLETYQTERAPHVREFIELAIRLGGLINTKAAESGLSAGTQGENGAAKLEVKKPLLGPGLSTSDPKFAGRLAPQFWLNDGRRSDDRTGYAFSLLTSTEFAGNLSGHVMERLSEAKVDVVRGDEAPDLEGWLRAEGMAAVLVRPDRYILTPVDRPEALPELMAKIIQSTTRPDAA